MLPVEITLNGLDYTSSNVTYGFYDAFLLDIKPRLISQKGTTIITMIGLGFVNSEASELKALFGTKDYTSLSCSDKTPCILPATYLDKEHMRSSTMPQNTVKVVGKPNSTDIEEDGMTVEVSVYEDDFTEEGLEIWYYQDPTILDSNMVSVPNNLESPLIVDVDFHWDKNNYERFRRYGNFTCRFEVDGVVISTLARMERVPLGSLDGVNMTNTPNAVFCDTPVMYHVGKGKVSLTLNGQDSFGDFPFEFTESLELYRISPQCGPIDGHTAAKLMGKGFLTHNHAYGKFGTLGTSLIDKATILNYAWNEQEYHNAMMLTTSDFSKFKQKQHVLAPGESLQTQIRPSTKPDNITLGGPVYMSVGQSVRLPIEYKGQVVDAAYEDVTDVIASSEVKVSGDLSVG